MPKQITARQLQEKKIQAELKIAKILRKFNLVCAKNHFQVEALSLTMISTDHNRQFEADIHII